MRHGDFSDVAEAYSKYRPDYSSLVLDALVAYVRRGREGLRVADLGAGTGIWTGMVATRACDVVAVEPNEQMRARGRDFTDGRKVQWLAGSAESTGLPDESFDWVTMASSFHWVRQPDGLREIKRILRPGGYFTVLWNPRVIDGIPLHEQIERSIYELLPSLTRVSSGGERHARDYGRELISTGDFSEVVYFEASHEILMSKERYLGIWRSVNDIQTQAGPELFKSILAKIDEILNNHEVITTVYKTRAWTAKRT